MNWKTSLKKSVFFWAGEYRYTEYGFDQQRLIWCVFNLWYMVFELVLLQHFLLSNSRCIMTGVAIL